MMTLQLAKGEVPNVDNKTIRDDDAGHEMVECGHSWLRVGNNMSTEGQVIVDEERKGSRMGRTKRIKIRRKKGPW